MRGYLFAAVVCLLGLIPRAHAQHRTLGYLQHAYAAANSGHAVKELGLDANQAAVIAKATLPFFTSDEFRTLQRTCIQWQAAELEDYFNGFTAQKASVDAFNAGVLAKLDELLETRHRRHRFRQLLTQFLVTSWNFDGLIRLHDLNVDFNTYRKLDASIRAAKGSLRSQPLYEYEAGMRLLATLLTDDVLRALSGEAYQGNLGAQKGSEPIIFDESKILLLGRPEILVELKLTAKQAKALQPVVAAMRKHYSHSKTYDVASTASDETQAAVKLESWHQDVESQLIEVLDAEQTARLNQLVFQRHVRSLNFPLVLRLAGVTQRFNPLDANWVQAEAFYSQQIESFNHAFVVFADLVGTRQAQRLCGKVHVVHSPWRHHDVKRDEEILKHVTARMKIDTDSRVANPRRRDREAFEP